MSETITDKYSGQTEITDPEHALSAASAKGFTLKPGEQTTIATCVLGTTRIRVVNSNKEHGKFWFRAGVHPIEEHAIVAETSQLHDRLFGGGGAFLGNHGAVPLYFETSC